MEKRILLTGGAGFLGANIIHRLVDLGYETASYDAQINFINNDKYYHKCLKLRTKLYHQPAKKYTGDIRDKNILTKAVKNFRPNIIIHLAGLAMARPLPQFADQMIPLNLTGTLNVLDVFEKSNAEKFVYTSSSMAYGHFKQTPQTEQFILSPINVYGACKAAGEYFVKLSNKQWVIVRPTSVYGFTDCANRVSQLLIDAAFLNRNAWVVQGETLDFSYVDDVVEGFVDVIRKKEANFEIFNISRGEARAAIEYAEIVKKYFPDFIYTVKNPNMGQVYRGPQDIDKARKILKYNPRYSIEEGIKRIIELSKEYNFYKGL